MGEEVRGRRRICTGTHDYSVIAIHNESKGAVDPNRVSTEAYSNTKAEGSSKACIISLTANWLHAANVGDSGFMVIRDKELIYQSSVQHRRFNCPYQLGNSEKCDHPSSAKELEVAVEPGDIIVAGTDGLFDNMYPTEIENVLNEGREEGIKPEKLALTIAELALYNSLDKYADTPFARAARWAGHNINGGKIDEITVIVGHMYLLIKG